MRPYQISVCGDSAVNIVVANEISETSSAIVRNASARVKAAGIAGIEDIIPTFCAVMVQYNPEIISYEELVSALHANLDGLSAEGAAAGKTIVIPVCYGGDFGPDLEHVATYHNMSGDDVVRLHTEPTYSIAMLGFLPGFAYLGGLNARLETPRLETPRVRIEAGAVGIGGAQTGIYPLASPGGWQIIGRSPVRPYDPERKPAFLYAAGDHIKFEAIDAAEYARIEAAISEGSYVYRVEGGL